MTEPRFETAEFLRGLADISGVAPEDADAIRLLADWATPERLDVVHGITRQVANSVIPTTWSEVPDAAAQQVVAQPNYMLLREPATGRQSAPDGEPVHIPMELVVHFTRLFVLLATAHATPEVLEGVRILRDAEQRAPESSEDAAAGDAVVALTAHLDQLMAAEISKNRDLENFVTTVLLFLMTDDPDEALRLDADLEVGR